MLRLLLVLVVAVTVGWWLTNYRSVRPAAPATVDEVVSPTSELADPVAGWRERITLKPFGILITPADSPVQPERFRGYHTGADIEYVDVTDEVPVYSLADGEIVLSRTADGYGGVVVIYFEHRGKGYAALYGHLRPASLRSAGRVNQGEQIGVLGRAYSTETGGERRHLHLAILNSSRTDLHGYVNDAAELAGWLDPLAFFARGVQ